MTVPSLTSWTAEIDPGLATLEGVEAVDPAATFYWEEPASGLLLAGHGSQWEHVAIPGSGAVGAASLAAAEVFARLRMAGDGGGRGPRLMGGFAFSQRFEAAPPPGANRWDAFPAGSFVLPTLTLERNEGRAWLTAAVRTRLGAGKRAEELVRSALRRLRARAVQRRHVPLASAPPPDANGEDAGENAGEDAWEDAFRALVKQAVVEVESGRLAKVVAARSTHVEGAADPWQIIATLRRRYPSCVIYAVFRSGSVFLGASPELLVELRHGDVSSNAVAGTTVRGADSHADARLEDSLRHDPKELAEHQYVVQGLRRALHEAGVDLDPPAGLEIVKLANVQHLGSPVTGVAAPGTTILDLVGAVHPTPAVAGLPRTAALEWLAANEALDRGWYAGPIGFVDPDLEGSFRVALRCALLRGDRARLFAGAGIVAGSRPERELAETTAKLRAMLDSLRGG